MDRSIVKKHIQLPIAAYLLVVAGISIFEYTSHLSQIHKTYISSIFILISIAFIFWGFLSGIVDKSYFKHIGSGTKIYFFEKYFDKKDFQELSRIIESGKFENLANLHSSSSYSTKLQIAYSADKTFCMVQIVKYIPYKFAQRTKAKELDMTQAKRLLEQVNINAL